MIEFSASVIAFKREKKTGKPRIHIKVPIETPGYEVGIYFIMSRWTFESAGFFPPCAKDPRRSWRARGYLLTTNEIYGIQDLSGIEINLVARRRHWGLRANFQGSGNSAGDYPLAANGQKCCKCGKSAKWVAGSYPSNLSGVTTLRRYPLCKSCTLHNWKTVAHSKYKCRVCHLGGSANPAKVVLYEETVYGNRNYIVPIHETCARAALKIESEKPIWRPAPVGITVEYK